ncbi:hypothetical protein EON82_14640 [bacterium]|nr:MAG: hypothetical protein EON82_14640 [bacterium]
MEDYKASLVAVGVGGFAIGGFWIARPTASAATFRVIEQRNLPLAGIGLDRDAAVLFRIAAPAGQGDRDVGLQYRIVDRANRIYPIVPMNDRAFPNAYKLQRGYSHRAVAPRLVAVAGTEIVGSVSVGDLPEPIFEGLLPKPNPFMSVVRRNGFIDVRPRSRIPRNERWRVVVRRTQNGTVSDVWTMLPNRGFRTWFPGFAIPFGNETEVVELELTRYRLREIKNIVQLSGLRLREQRRAPCIVIDRSQFQKVRLGPYAIDIAIPQQDTGPFRVRTAHPPRVARASVNIAFSPDTETLRLQKEPPLSVRSAVEILSPDPAELGLSELRLGAAVRETRLPAGTPIKTGPFAARLLVTVWKPEAVGQFIASVPVENAPPMVGTMPSGFSAVRP